MHRPRRGGNVHHDRERCRGRHPGGYVHCRVELENGSIAAGQLKNSDVVDRLLRFNPLMSGENRNDPAQFLRRLMDRERLPGRLPRVRHAEAEEAPTLMRVTAMLARSEPPGEPPGLRQAQLRVAIVSELHRDDSKLGAALIREDPR